MAEPPKTLNKKFQLERSNNWGTTVCKVPVCQNGGVTGRPETMCPRTNVLGPLVPWMNRPGNTLSLL